MRNFETSMGKTFYEGLPHCKYWIIHIAMNRVFALRVLGSFCLLVVAATSAFAQLATFNVVDSPQYFTVPAGVTSLTVDARGAQGGGLACYSEFQSVGGCGGRVQAVLTVTPGQVLKIVVGEHPGVGGGTIGPGGYGGGGADSDWTTTFPGAGGGGATLISDVATGALLVVAGGGGGGGGDECTSGTGDLGGAGGGLTGGTGLSVGCTTGGYGGTQTSGGSPGTCSGFSGGFGGYLLGGTYAVSSGSGSGGGGGGYYGGGTGSYGGGGGGGSSYANPLFTTTVVHTQGYNCGQGLVLLDTPCTSAGALTGPSSLCAGDSALFTSTIPGGSWSGGAGIAVVGAGGMVRGVVAGATYVTYTLGACDAALPLTVDASAGIASVSGPAMLCSGNTVTLIDTSLGGTWSSSAPSVATIGATSGVVTGVGMGVATFTYTVVNACGTFSKYFTDSVGPADYAGVITGTDTVAVGTLTTLSDAVAGGEWYSSNGFIAGVGTAGNVFAFEVGVDTLFYVVTTSCGSDTAYFPFVVVPLLQAGNLVAGANVIRVAPNPFSGRIGINYSQQGTTPAVFRLWDVTGRCLMQVQLANGQNELPAGNLPQGAYRGEVIDGVVRQEFSLMKLAQ